MSIREELSQRLQRKVDGITSTESLGHELLLGSLTSESNTFSNAEVDLVRNEARDSLELIACLEQEDEKQMQPAFPVLKKAAESVDADSAKRSESCRWSQDFEVFSLSPERSDEIKEERSMWTKKGKLRAWSFHTVEEYNAILEKICLSREEQTGFNGKDNGSEHAEPATKQSPLKNGTQVKENAVFGEKEFLFSTTEGSNVVEDAAENFEKGFKRKARANELKSIKVPETIEFQGVSSLKEWLDAGGQVYSSGTYVTPKFGSYTLPSFESANKCSDSAIFDPELVAAFEKCMEKLEVEEESILKQIEDDFESQSNKEKQEQEEIPFHTSAQM